MPPQDERKEQPDPGVDCRPDQPVCVVEPKALEAGKQNNLAKQLKDGPEGQWLYDVKMVAHITRRLIKQAPAVIYAGQSNLDKRCCLTAFEETKGLFLSLDRKIRNIKDDIREQKTKGNGTASIRLRDKTNQSSFEDIA